MASLSSRDRMLRAIGCEEPDHVPCCFMIFSALERRCKDPFEFVERQLALGLDAFVQVPSKHVKTLSDHADLYGPPVRFDPRVEVKEWREERKGERYPILCKEYETPAGTLRVEASRSEDWPYGDHVPFLDDFLIPRSTKRLVTEPKDLAALRYLLQPTPKEDAEEFLESAAEAKRFAEERGLLVLGGWGVTGDMVGWLCGLSNIPFMAVDAPEFLQELVGIISAWNRQRMELILDAGVDVFIRRGWYECTDFWSPAVYRRLILPGLKQDVALAHERGAKFAYINTTSTMPLLDPIAEAGVDVLVGVDPVQGQGTDMAAMKEQLGGKVAVWGGVNGFVTVERGTPHAIRGAVTEAMDTLGPDGLILSPVDNVRDTSDEVWQNVLVMIEAWKETWQS